MTDTEAIAILQEFAYAKPLKLQAAVEHVEYRLAILSAFWRTSFTAATTAATTAERVRALEQAADAALRPWEESDGWDPRHPSPRVQLALAMDALRRVVGWPEATPTSDVAIDATPPAPAASRFDAGAG